MPYEFVNEPSKTNQSFGKSLARTPLVAAGKVGAFLPGQFGDIARMAYEGTGKLLGAVGLESLKGPAYEQSFLGKALPTTQQHEQVLQEAYPILKPKNKIEKFGSNLISDFAQIYAGTRAFGAGNRPSMQPYLPSASRSAAISLGANTLGKGVEFATGDESKGDLVKHGSMLGMLLWSPRSARNLINDLYATERSLLPQNASINAQSFQNQLDNMRNNILQGRPRGNISPQREWVLNQIDRFENLIQNGQININQLKSQLQDFNSEMNSRGLFQQFGSSEVRDIRNYARNLSRYSNQVFTNYGTQNPQWINAYRNASNAHSAVEQSNFISKAVKNVLEKGSFRGRGGELLSHLFEFGGPGLISFLNPIAGIGTTAAYQAAKIGYRMFRSPELLQHYSRILRTALKGDSRMLDKELKSFSKEIEKTNSSKYEFVD
jgi:hypothetical protein